MPLPNRPQPDQLLRRRFTTRVWDRLCRRPPVEVELCEQGIRIREPHGEVYDVPHDEIGHVQILGRRDLILGFGHPEHAFLRIPMSRLTASDRFDLLRERLETSGHSYSTAEEGLLEHSKAAVFDQLLPVDGETTSALWGDPASPHGESRIQIGDREFSLATTPYTDDASQSFCREVRGDQSIQIFRIAHGRILSPHGVVLGWFEPLGNGLYKNSQRNQPIGFHLRTLDGAVVIYDATTRIVTVNSVRGELAPCVRGIELRFEQPVDRRIALVTLALTRFLRVDRNRADPLRLADSSSKPEDFRESSVALLRFLPLLPFLLIPFWSPELLPYLVTMITGQFLISFLVMRFFSNPLKHPSWPKKTWSLRRALLTTEHSATLRLSLGVHHDPLLHHSIGHVRCRRRHVVLTAGFGGRFVDRVKLCLRPEQVEALKDRIRASSHNSLLSCESADGTRQTASWDWSDLLCGDEEIDSARFLSARNQARQMIQTRLRLLELHTRSETTVVEVSDAIGKVPLFHISNSVLTWHTGARLAAITAVRNQSATITTPQGVVLAITRQGIRLDGALVGRYRYRDGRREIACPKPVPEALMALAAGLCVRFEIDPAESREPAPSDAEGQSDP